MFLLKRLAYTAFVRPGLGYACVVWDPHTFKDKYNSSKWITSSYGWKDSATELLAQLNLEPLEDRRRISRLVFMNKILNGYVVVRLEHMEYKSKTCKKKFY